MLYSQMVTIHLTCGGSLTLTVSQLNYTPYFLYKNMVPGDLFSGSSISACADDKSSLRNLAYAFKAPRGVGGLSAARNIHPGPDLTFGSLVTPTGNPSQ